jgi:hypothetical protein
MGQKLVIGPIGKGQFTSILPFNIDNDSFPKLINAYQWRQRIRRKRGTQFLGRLTNLGATTITLNGSGSGNLLTAIISGPPTINNPTIVPGSVTITDSTIPATYVDTGGAGILFSGITPEGTINYSTGAIVILASAGHSVTASFEFFPNLPIMGLEDLDQPLTTSNLFPGTIGFNPLYAYNISTSFPYNSWNVSFYKNPQTSAGAINPNFINYVQKTVANTTPFYWNGKDYQQFWTTNYEGAFWATNGIHVPYISSQSGIGMQFAPASTITIGASVAGPPATIILTITNCPLVIGDFVFLNEWTIVAGGALATALNFQTGYVTASSINTLTPATKTITITLPFATLATGAGIYAPGIVQYLTNVSDPTVDCLKWYDGDPTIVGVIPATPTGLGWVNFCPPLSEFIYSIADAPQSRYYLVGAKMILPFKDRLVAFGAIIQDSSGAAPIYLQDTIIFSQNGTPYYTASFTGNAELVTTEFIPILTPVNQGATANAWWEDQTGFGGFQSVGIAQPITLAEPNQDVIIVSLGQTQTRLIFTANDFQPFSFFLINSELGTSSTFSGVIMDKFILSRGPRGFVMTSQVSAERFDTQILDSNFQISLQNNGNERFTAQRDYENEWVYFTYPSNSYLTNFYPNQTLQYNYRDDTWATFNESYTHYGQFRKVDGQTWATIGNDYPTWREWNDTWDSGESTLLQPQVIAGNAQGFIVFRGEGTGEANSIYILNIVGNLVTSPNHCLNNGDYIVVNGVLGTIGPTVNGLIFSVAVSTATTFVLNSSTNIISGTYAGGGTIQRMYFPQVLTKQFPMAWEMGRKTRIGPQMYLLTTTNNSQITLQIYLSQDATNDFTLRNDALMYSQVLFTCPESTNLGLTPYNTNLQQLNYVEMGNSPSAQIWHRVNNSLIGDTVQLGFTMSDAQMRDPNFTNQFSEIELHGIILDVSPSSVLA